MHTHLEKCFVAWTDGEYWNYYLVDTDDEKTAVLRLLEDLGGEALCYEEEFSRKPTDEELYEYSKESFKVWKIPTIVTVDRKMFCVARFNNKGIMYLAHMKEDTFVEEFEKLFVGGDDGGREEKRSPSTA
jgi:hypothetical protein